MDTWAIRISQHSITTILRLSIWQHSITTILLLYMTAQHYDYTALIYDSTALQLLYYCTVFVYHKSYPMVELPGCSLVKPYIELESKALLHCAALCCWIYPESNSIPKSMNIRSHSIVSHTLIQTPSSRQGPKSMAAFDWSFGLVWFWKCEFSYHRPLLIPVLYYASYTEILVYISLYRGSLQPYLWRPGVPWHSILTHLLVRSIPPSAW